MEGWMGEMTVCDVILAFIERPKQIAGNAQQTSSIPIAVQSHGGDISSSRRIEARCCWRSSTARLEGVIFVCGGTGAGKAECERDISCQLC